MLDLAARDAILLFGGALSSHFCIAC
jgi:hypothetical protein